MRFDSPRLKAQRVSLKSARGIDEVEAGELAFWLVVPELPEEPDEPLDTGAVVVVVVGVGVGVVPPPGVGVAPVAAEKLDLGKLCRVKYLRVNASSSRSSSSPLSDGGGADVVVTTGATERLPLLAGV